MPILVQWKWQEQTKTFLVIFHLDNDYSKPNLRTRKMRFEGKQPFYLYIPHDLIPPDQKQSNLRPIKIRTVMTWAPSHFEIGLLMELLNYANIINGLNETKKRELRKKLEIVIDLQKKEVYPEYYENFREELLDKIFLFGYDEISNEKKPKWVFCAELCPEYIDYLRKILKPHLN